jgi:chemotaxis signal transduction protein
MSNTDIQEKKMDLVNQYFEVFDQFDLYVIFQVAAEQFGIEARRVQAVSRFSEPMRLPRTPSYIQGLFNFRREMIPLLNMGKICGRRATAPTDGTMIIVVESDGHSFGLMADEIIDCENLPQSGIHPLKDPTKHLSGHPFDIAVFQGNGASIRLLDPDKIAALEPPPHSDEESGKAFREKVQNTG